MDYAANACFMDMDEFFELFITGGLADQFGAGVPKIVSGMSGTELVWEVLHQSGVEHEMPEPREEFTFSPEYWCGWILAYYQWYTGLAFKEIMRVITCREIKKLYPTLHEAAEEKFVDTVNSMVRRKNLPTKLRTIRKARGLTQRVLAEKAGVNLRTIQQYELRTKDINKAAASTLAALAKVLGCRIEDLLEYDYGEVKEE